MPELLTYPWDSQYPKNNLDQFYGATAAAPNLPTDAVTEQGFGNVTDGGYNWQQSSIPSYGSDTSVYDRQYTNNSTSWGFGYEEESATSLKHFGWFDVGAGANMSSGQVLDVGTKSSYMKDVTACWFVSSNNNSDTSGNCLYEIRRVAIKYINPESRRIILISCPTVLAGLAYNADTFAGASPKINGYEISESNKNVVEIDDLRLIGFRIGLYIAKDSTPRSRKTQVGINGLTPGFLDSAKTYSKDTKRVICRNSSTTHTQFENETKFPIECR